MEVLMDYHLVFMAMAFVLLVLTILILFNNPNKELVWGAAILAGINWVLCLVNSYAFFGLGIIGIDSSGSAVITAHHEMYSFYAIFYLLYWVNVVLLFRCYWLWVRNPWDIDNPGSSELSVADRRKW